MSFTLPEELLRQDTVLIINEVLAPEEVRNIEINNFIIGRALSSDVEVSFNIGVENIGYRDVASFGSGVIDAFLTGIVESLKMYYPTLQNLKIIDFQMKAYLDPLKGGTNADAYVEVLLGISAQSGRHVYFRHVDRSMIVASIEAVRMAAEYYINCEEAVKALTRIIADAKLRHRADLVQSAGLKMVELVKVNDFQKVLASSSAKIK